MAQVEIWALPNQPLRRMDIMANGYQSLKDYVRSLADGHNNHQRMSCKTCMIVSSQPLASFGTFNPVTGEKKVLMTCMNENELPIESIEGCYDVGVQNQHSGMVEL